MSRSPRSTWRCSWPDWSCMCLYDGDSSGKPGFGHAVGWPMAVTGLLVVIWAMRTIEAMDISKPTAIVTTGPYALSRNPMYVAWTFIYAGIGVIVNSVWPLIFLPVAIIFTHYMSVIHEEHRLEEEFGDEYRRYRNKVRRYL